MKAIITGITGQDGSHLADLLLNKGYGVVGISRRCSTDNTQRIKHILNHERFKLVEGDITDVSSVINIFKDNEDVDEVYNLAAQSHVATSFKQPALTWDITGKGCLNLLQSLVDLNMRHVKFYQASSSEMFGSSYDLDNNGDKYQNENTKFMPQSPYAIAKCAAHYAVGLYRCGYGLHASCGILFNHEGPRRGENFVTQKIIKWIADYIHSGKSHDFPKLRLGNLESFRDWGYAGDYVEAMWLMLQQDIPQDYVICTGETHTIAEFLNIAFYSAGITDYRDLYVIDQEFYRPSEVDYLRGDCSKAKNKLGWQPKTNLEGLVKLMLDAQL
jgi:GDPmannose 4,6-dehydratase